MNTPNKVIVIGQQPSSPWTNGGLSKSKSIERLNRWMSDCGITYFSFMNIMGDVNQKLPTLNDKTGIYVGCSGSRNYKIVALGNQVSKLLTDMGIKHFKLPHPSGRNRLLNDKSFEKNIIIQFANYLND